MDHRTSARAVRALAGGGDAFVSALERAPDYDAAVFERFLTRHQLLDWVAPVLASGRAEHLIGPGFRERLLEYRAARVARNQALLHESVRGARGRSRTAGLGCLFLKGLYLGHRFYGDVNRRHQCDVDVLVRSRQLEASLATLARLGYDVKTNLDDGKPVATRLREIRGPAARQGAARPSPCVAASTSSICTGA